MQSVPTHTFFQTNSKLINTVTSVLTVAAVYLLLAGRVAAFTASPSTLDLEVGESQAVTINANNTGSTNGVTVILDTENLEVTGVILPEGLLSIPTCADGENYTSTAVCVDIAATEPFSPAQTLVTVEVRKVAEGPARLFVGEGSKYANGEEVSGDLATVAGTSGLGNSTVSILLIVGGVVIGLIALYLAFKMGSRGNKPAPAVAAPVSNPVT